MDLHKTGINYYLQTQTYLKNIKTLLESVAIERYSAKKIGWFWRVLPPFDEFFFSPWRNIILRNPATSIKLPLKIDDKVPKMEYKNHFQLQI